MVETVGAVLAVFLDAHMGAFANFVEVRSLVANERNSWENFAVAFCKYNAVCIFLESPFADADVFLVCKELENFVRVVTVFAGSVAQVEFSVVVLVEKFLHAIRMVIMSVAQDACIDFGNVDAHVGGVLGELCGGSRVEQNALAVEFGIDAKSPFAFQLLWRFFCRAGVASGTADVVYENFYVHNVFFGGGSRLRGNDRGNMAMICTG